MDPGALIPSPDIIPLPAGWFHFLLLATFVLHLLLMNTMLGGAIIALVNSLRRPAPGGADQEISRKLPYVVAFTVNLGVPPLLFLQVLYGHFVYVSSLLMAVYWLSVFMLVMLAYYGAYLYDLKFAALGRGRALVIGLAVALLLVVAFIFSNNMTLMLRPQAWPAYFSSRQGFLLNWGEPSLAPRYLHFVIASLAVGGLALALLGRWQERHGQPQGEALVSQGLRWFTRATLVQLAGGLWFLFSLPQDILALFTGGSGGHTLALWCGVGAGLAALALGFRRRPLAAAALAVTTVALMVVVRDLLRAAYLRPYFSLDSLSVAPQYSPALVFAGSLAVVAVIVVYLLRLAYQARKEA